MRKFLNSMIGLMLGAALFFAAPAMESEAAEYSVAPADAILYTNDNTVILSDADDASVVLPEVAADLPIQVTGVTSLRECTGQTTITLRGRAAPTQAVLAAQGLHLRSAMRHLEIRRQ